MPPPHNIYDGPIVPRWRGLPIVPTWHAQEAADALDIDILGIADLPERSETCPDSRRARGKEDRCVPWKGRHLRIVVKSARFGWFPETDVWVVTNIKVFVR